MVKYILERKLVFMRKITKEMVKNFELYLYEEEKSGNTIEKYLRDIRFFKEWLNGRELEKSVVLEYKRELCGKYAPASVNSILSSLNALFAFLGWHEFKVKTLKIQRQIFASSEKELTKAEYERLLMAAKNKKNEKLYYLMQTIASCGIRISELSAITTLAVKTGQATINCKGKIRQIFLPKALCKMLKEYIKRNNIKSGSVFVSRTGQPLNRSNVWKMLKNLCESAKVSKDKVFPHNFRHLFARTFYSLQKDIVRLADILGHSSVNTTRLYTMETGIVHQKQLQKLGLLRC
ncbi:MAG: tyrosine-type recombinase/integrase [Clostridia bacterium]|nr:tyrosine-type recombinase/integrase [Clostridia bacterium]